MILIGGGTGFVGRHLVRQLRATGHKVTVLSRSPGPEQMTWMDLQRCGIPEGCKAVVNLSGRNILETNPWLCVTGQWNTYKQETISSRVGTTETLARAIEASSSPPSVLVNASAIGYYNPKATEPQDEDSPGGDYDDYMGPMVANWEKAAELSKPEKTRSVIIRIGVVLGRDGGVLQRAYWPFYFGLGGPMGSGRQWFPWIHIEDIVGIFRYAIFNTEIKGVLNGVAPDCVTNGEFSKAFGQALGRPAILPVPEFSLRLAYGERSKVVLESPKVVPRRTLEWGYQFKFPNLHDALHDLLGKK